MKYLLVGDIHGARLSHLIKILDKTNPDVVVCTGDFGAPESIMAFVKFETRFVKEESNH